MGATTADTELWDVWARDMITHGAYYFMLRSIGYLELKKIDKIIYQHFRTALPDHLHLTDTAGTQVLDRPLSQVAPADQDIRNLVTHALHTLQQLNLGHILLPGLLDTQVRERAAKASFELKKYLVLVQAAATMLPAAQEAMGILKNHAHPSVVLDATHALLVSAGPLDAPILPAEAVVNAESTDEEIRDQVVRALQALQQLGQGDILPTGLPTHQVMGGISAFCRALSARVTTNDAARRMIPTALEAMGVDWRTMHIHQRY
jgi:hypothetical protein